MKKNYVTLFFIFLLVFLTENSYAQIVNIPDANFKAALLAYIPVINTNGDGEIQVSEAQAFAGSLLVSSKSITDITGIEAFTALTGLWCGNNQLTSLNLTANTALTGLDCNGNQLTQLDLTTNIALTRLQCPDNQLTSLDLTTNTALTILDCHFNQLSSLDLTTNNALTRLQCHQNQLALLDLTTNTALTILDCYNNQLTSLDFTTNTALTDLNCSFNQLTSLDFTTNTALTDLVCDKNQLTSLNLGANAALTSLSCSYNQLTSLNLGANAALTTLSCYNNQLTSLDLTTNTALTNLYCFDNQLTSLDVTVNTALTDLNCYSNQLTTLDLTTNTALTRVQCFGNQLTSLNLTANASLTTLQCNNNELKLLNLTANTALKTLQCNNNELASLNLTANTALIQLDCSFNQLTSLNLTANTALYQLFCSSNQLNSLDFRNGNNMNLAANNMRATYNPNLTCVSVDDPVWSAANWTSKDPQTQFSSNCACGVFSIYIDSVRNVSCSDSGYALASVSGSNGPFQYDWLDAPLSTDSILIADTAGIYILKVTDANSCESFRKLVLKSPKVMSSYDLNSNLHAGVFRPGRLTAVDLEVWNDGCTVENAKLKIVYHGPLEFESSQIPPTTHNGNTLTWDLDTMEYSINDFFNAMQFRVDSNARLGFKVCFEVFVTPTGGDADKENNFKSYCFTIVNSYDPNDKQVYPHGICAENYTLKNQPLTYTIRFQNTGTAPAIDVFLIDSLSPYLNINTIRVLQASHEGLITEVLENDILKFDFKNINLADSLSDSAGSKGFVTYQIEPYSGLSDGTVIENSAGIYFDFNPPVITNTTRNTLVSVLPALDTVQLTETVCQSYTAPDGHVYLLSGNYFSITSDESGCDSTITINLTVNNPSISSISETVCSVYTAPDGTIYSTSGTYTSVIPNALGCDSTISINLTVNNPSTSSITESVCSTYTAPDGQVYSTSGNYTAIVPNAEACDSTITINLTVNNPSTSSITETVCGNYIAADGQIFTNSGNYVVTIPNALGCDSIISYQLTVNQVDTLIIIAGSFISANVSGAVYQWLDCGNGMIPISGETSQGYDVIQDGVYAVQLTQNGCTDTSACTPMSLQGLTNLAGDSRIMLYPNPTDGLFHLSLGLIYSEVTIKITDLQGREIKREQVSNQQQLELELNEADGIYLVHVLSGNQELTVIRLIKN